MVIIGHRLLAILWPHYAITVYGVMAHMTQVPSALLSDTHLQLGSQCLYRVRQSSDLFVRQK